MEDQEIWVDKSEAERVRIAVNEFKEKLFLDIRQYYQAEDGDWRPTKKGVSLPADKLDELKMALEKLQVPDAPKTDEPEASEESEASPAPSPEPSDEPEAPPEQ